MFIVNVYILPAKNNDTYERIFSSIEQHCDLSTEVVIVGDFNVPELYNQLSGNQNTFSTEVFATLNLFMNFNALMSQDNYVLNANRRILDLVLTSQKLDCLVTRSDESLVPEDSHHPTLMIKTSWVSKACQSNFDKNYSYSYNYTRADFRGLYGDFVA